MPPLLLDACDCTLLGGLRGDVAVAVVLRLPSALMRSSTATPFTGCPASNGTAVDGSPLGVASGGRGLMGSATRVPEWLAMMMLRGRAPGTPAPVDEPECERGDTVLTCDGSATCVKRRRRADG